MMAGNLITFVASFLRDEPEDWLREAILSGVSTELLPTYAQWPLGKYDFIPHGVILIDEGNIFVIKTMDTYHN